MRLSFSALLSVTVLVFGCSRQAEIMPSIRLVDRFGEAQLEGTPPVSDPVPPTEWKFEKRQLQGWQVTQGIRGLAVRNGRLAGRTTSAFPVLHLERQDTGEPDELHAVEIRLRTTAGANLSIGFSDDEAPEMGPTLGYLDLFPWSKTPIVAGQEVLSYTLTSPFPAQTSDTRHIFLRPTDAAGANFEIESIRLVPRREYLAEFPSGVGWQGLGEIYRESIVARSPERVEYHLELPSDPFFEVALGSPQDDPLTFRIGVSELERPSRPLVVERTITTAGRWEPVQLDLADHAGRLVSISLELEAEDSGTIGFWGTPAI